MHKVCGPDYALVRLALRDCAETDFVSSGQDNHRFAATMVALHAAFSFTLSVLMLLRYMNLSKGAASEAARLAMRASEQEFLVAVAMLVTALTLAVSYKAVYPDRRDAVLLGGQPLSRLRLFRARLAAVSLAPVVLTLAASSSSGIVFASASAGAGSGLAEIVLRIGAHWLVCLLASGFVLGLTFLIQGVMFWLLPWRAYMRLSAAAQFLILSATIVYFTSGLGAAGERWSAWLPAKWFVELYQGLMLAQGRSWLGLVAQASWVPALLPVGLFVFGSGYRRMWRNVVEGTRRPGSAPWRLTLAPGWILRQTVLRAPEEEAVFFFVWRALIRNQKYRFLLALYTSTGAALVAGGILQLVNSGRLPPVPTALVVSMPLEFAALLVIGLRAVMPLPVELPANWVFQLNAVREPRYYGRVVRKLAALITGGVVLAATLPLFLYAWGWQVAGLMALMEILLIGVLVEALFGRYQRIPFTSSYAPDKANLRFRLAIYLLLFLFLSALTSHAVSSALSGATPVGVVASLIISAGLAIRWWAKRKRDVDLNLQYEETTAPALTLLGIGNH